VSWKLSRTVLRGGAIGNDGSLLDTGETGHKTPHYFSAPSDEPLALAGLWEQSPAPDGGEVLSATIVVGAANAWMGPFHDRMPIVLDWKDTRAWLSGDHPETLLHPPPEGALREWVVSTRVNRAGVGDDDATLTAPV
jgi:putative SOS response-associated peptidase YedK